MRTGLKTNVSLLPQDISKKEITHTHKKHKLKHHTEWKDTDHIVHCHDTKSACTLLSTVQPASYLHTKRRENATKKCPT